MISEGELREQQGIISSYSYNFVYVFVTSLKRGIC